MSLSTHSKIIVGVHILLCLIGFVANTYAFVVVFSWSTLAILTMAVSITALLMHFVCRPELET